MRLAEVLVAVGVATVVPHVDGRHLGDVQGAVVPKVLEGSTVESGGGGETNEGGNDGELWGRERPGALGGRRCRTAGGDGERDEERRE